MLRVWCGLSIRCIERSGGWVVERDFIDKSRLCYIGGWCFVVWGVRFLVSLVDLVVSELCVLL